MATDQKRVRVLRPFYVEKELVEKDSVFDMRSGDAFAMQAANKVEIVDPNTPLRKSGPPTVAVAVAEAPSKGKGGGKDG